MFRGPKAESKSREANACDPTNGFIEIRIFVPSDHVDVMIMTASIEIFIQYTLIGTILIFTVTFHAINTNVLWMWWRDSAY